MPQLGPYDEHLIKDVGAYYLAITVLSLVALANVRKPGVVPMAGATLLVVLSIILVVPSRMVERRRF